MLESSVACSPEYLAEYTPGAPPKASTHSPESSAIVIIPVYFAISKAFLAELASNVSPSSTTSGISIPSLIESISIFFTFLKIAVISSILCLFPVARNIFIISILLLLHFEV